MRQPPASRTPSSRRPDTRCDRPRRGCRGRRSTRTGRRSSDGPPAPSGRSRCRRPIPGTSRLGRVTVAGLRQTGEVDAAEGPVGQEQAAAILLRELPVPIADDAGRRAAAQVGDRGDHVGEVRRHPPERGPLRRLPAVVAAGDDVIEPAALVPRQDDAALVVGIEGEQFAVAVEVEAVGVAEAVGDDLANRSGPAGSGGRRRRSALGSATSAGRRLRRDAGLVAAEQVEPAVRPAAEGVGVVLAAGLELVDEFRRADRLAVRAESRSAAGRRRRRPRAYRPPRAGPSPRPWDGRQTRWPGPPCPCRRRPGGGCSRGRRRSLGPAGRWSGCRQSWARSSPANSVTSKARRQRQAGDLRDSDPALLTESRRMPLASRSAADMFWSG